MCVGKKWGLEVELWVKLVVMLLILGVTITVRLVVYYKYDLPRSREQEIHIAANASCLGGVHTRAFIRFPGVDHVPAIYHNSTDPSQPSTLNTTSLPGGTARTSASLLSTDIQQVVWGKLIAVGLSRWLSNWFTGGAIAACDAGYKTVAGVHPEVVPVFRLEWAWKSLVSGFKPRRCALDEDNDEGEDEDEDDDDDDDEGPPRAGAAAQQSAQMTVLERSRESDTALPEADAAAAALVSAAEAGEAGVSGAAVVQRGSGDLV